MNFLRDTWEDIAFVAGNMRREDALIVILMGIVEISFIVVSVYLLTHVVF
jgi:hypothetical protein